MDIEEDSDVSFLNKTRCIAIEIHDEVADRNKIYQLLQNKGFILLEDKETTIVVNKGI